MPGITAFIPLMSAGATAVGNIISQGMANYQNTKLANMANEWSLEQWNRENEYNLPINQVQRMRDAGINPGLMYGNGGMMNEAASSPAVTSAAGSIRPYIMDPLTMAQVGLIDAQKEKTETESDVMAQKLPEELESMRQARKESDAKINELNQQVSNFREQILNMREDRKLTVEKQITESFNRTLASRQFDELCRKNTVEINKMGKEMELMDKQGKKIVAETEDIRAARDLKVQEYKYLAAANSYRLLGLQLDNSLKSLSAVLYGDQHTLNLDQHRLNSLQETLLGFDVSNGRLQASRSERLYNDTHGGDWILTHVTEPLVTAIGHLLSPVGDVLKISIK